MRILHQDQSLVVVDKPSGVPVHTTRGAVGVPMLQRVRDAVGQRVWLVHRLDAATSGALVLALDRETAGRLSWSFASGAVSKHYLAFVRGHPPKDSGYIDHPVARQDGLRVPAATSFVVLWTSGRYSLLLLRPHTGRRHQLRRHLKHMSWPIIGDVRYGKGEHNRLFRERGLHRLALHACRLELEHAGAFVSAVAPLPTNFAEPLRAFGVPEEVLAEAHEHQLSESDCKAESSQG